jgi:predicted MFS family arabinose efflux permease
MSMAAPASGTAPLFSKGYRAWLLTVLVLTNALNLADRQGLAAVAQAIKLDLKFSDAAMGMIQGLPFAVFYTLMGLPLARMSERLSRTRIISVCLALFGVMVALCGTASSFWGLLLFRVGVGIGDAGFVTPVASLIGDHYPMSRRASAMSIIWLGAPIGVICGSTLGGWLAEHVSWRASFVAIGTPALLVAILVFATLREPPRGMSDAVAPLKRPPPSTWTVLRFVFSKRSMWHVLIGCALAATAMNGIGQFIGQFLVRNFHLGFASAGRLIGSIAIIGMASGLALGGFGVDWAGRFDKRWYVWGPALGLVFAAPLFVLGFNQSTIAWTAVVLVVAHVAMFLYYTPTLAMAQNMVGADMRASSAFVVSIVLGLVGIGLGPPLLGFLSDHYAAREFTFGSYATSCPGGHAVQGSGAALADACSSASAHGLKYALMTLSLLCIWSAVHYLLAARNLRSDLEKQYVPEMAPVPAAGSAS